MPPKIPKETKHFKLFPGGKSCLLSTFPLARRFASFLYLLSCRSTVEMFRGWQRLRPRPRSRRCNAGTRCSCWRKQIRRPGRVPPEPPISWSSPLGWARSRLLRPLSAPPLAARTRFRASDRQRCTTCRVLQ